MSEPCKVCKYCPCCKKRGEVIDWIFTKYFPQHGEELKKHYEIYPEHENPEKS